MKKDRFKEGAATYYRKRRRARRLQAIEQLGGQCVKCGTKDNLEFDHIIPRDKTMNIAALLNSAQKTLDKELKKCQLLCKKCHLAKTMSEIHPRPRKAILIHGTIGGYNNHGCRCVSCKKAKADYASTARKRRAGKNDINHGTVDGYSNYSCRCSLCRAAWAKFSIGYYHKKKNLTLC